MKSPNNTFVRPGARRQTIPPGTILKSRLDRRKEEKKKSWKKEIADPKSFDYEQDRD
jgi:hypothetical protein